MKSLGMMFKYLLCFCFLFCLGCNAKKVDQPIMDLDMMGMSSMHGESISVTVNGALSDCATVWNTKKGYRSDLGHYVDVIVDMHGFSEEYMTFYFVDGMYVWNSQIGDSETSFFTKEQYSVQPGTHTVEAISFPFGIVKSDNMKSFERNLENATRYAKATYTCKENK